MTGETQRKNTEAAVTALFFVETRNRSEIQEVRALVERMLPQAEVCPLSEGIITAFAFRVSPAAMPLLAALETTLKRDYLFGHVQIPFQDTALRVVEELAMETGSALYEIGTCDICHAPEPFPSKAPVIAEDGVKRHPNAIYCGHCATAMSVKGLAEETPAEDAPKARRRIRTPA